MVRIPCFRCHGPGMISDHRAERSRKLWAWPKKKKKERNNSSTNFSGKVTFPLLAPSATVVVCVPR